VASHLSNHKITTLYSKRVMQRYQTAIRLLRERRKRALNLRIWIYIDFEIFGSGAYRLKKQILAMLASRWLTP
jgi:hypothetical protein